MHAVSHLYDRTAAVMIRLLDSPDHSLCPSGSGPSLAVNASATCASRPCFPGVQCINRRPPHVGYVCGRCPPGLYGNGRVCMKSAKAGEELSTRLTPLKRHCAVVENQYNLFETPVINVESLQLEKNNDPLRN